MHRNYIASSPKYTMLKICCADFKCLKMQALNNTVCIYYCFQSCVEYEEKKLFRVNTNY
jgi:hypothetical protein